MDDIRGRLLSQSLIRRLTAQSAVGTSVVVEVLQFAELLVEDLRVVDDHTLEEPVELLGIDPMRALHLAVEPRCLRFDVFVSNSTVEDMPVERSLELMGPAELDDAGFGRGGDLVRAPVGVGAAIGESGEAVVRVAHEPAVDGPSVDAVAGGDIGHRGALEHVSHGVVALLNHRKLHQHAHVLLGSAEHK